MIAANLIWAAGITCLLPGDKQSLASRVASMLLYILPSVLLYILPYLDCTAADQREAQTSRYDKEGRPPCPNTA